MELQNLLSLSTVFTVISFFLFLYVLSSIWRKRSTGHNTKPPPPPEAGGAWPLIGHLHLLGGSQPPHVTLGNLADKYGPVFTIRLGVHKTLVVSSSEIAKECFTVNDKAFASRPKSMSFEVMGYNFSMIGFSPYGPYWRHVRKIATMEVLSKQRIETLKHVMESEVETAIRESYNLWKESGNSDKAVITEMKKWFGDITMNVMLRMMVGKRFTGEGSNDKDNERIRRALRALFDLTGSFVVSDALPFLRWLDLDGQEKAMKNTMKELDYFVRNWLEEHKQNRNSGSWENREEHHHDFMDVLLSTIDQDFDGRDADTIIKATSLTLILAGTDTTSGTLTWAVSLLLNNREILKKAIDELDTQIGKERMVVEADLKNLVYLQAIIKETLRLYPATPLNVPHESMEDCVVGGYHVPAGTRLVTNISKIHRDPTLYPNDPLEFQPERFLKRHKGIDLRGQHFELIPFGAGRRMCPGMSFGLQMTHLILANLLHGFDAVSADGKKVDMVEHVGLTNIKASPLQVILTPRLSSRVYGEKS